MAQHRASHSAPSQLGLGAPDELRMSESIADVQGGRFLKDGALLGFWVPDQVGDALLDVIFNPDVADGQGLVIDGFPRTALQARAACTPCASFTVAGGPCEAHRQVDVSCMDRRLA